MLLGGLRAGAAAVAGAAAARLCMCVSEGATGGGGRAGRGGGAAGGAGGASLRDTVEDEEVKVLCGTAHPRLAADVARALGVPLARTKLGKFPDGETSIVIEDTVRDHSLFIIQPTVSNDALLELLLLVAAARRASCGRLIAVMPFFGYARQDRKERREPIAAADVASMLEHVGVDRVIGVDLHAGQIQGFFEVPMDNLAPWRVAVEYFIEDLPQLTDRNRKLVVVAAHENQVNRAKHFRDHLSEQSRRADIPLALVTKNRDREGSISHAVVGDVEDATCIIVDDIVSTGTTVTNGATELKRRGAREVYAFATHPRFRTHTLRTIEDCSALTYLLVTDSTPSPLRGSNEHSTLPETDTVIAELNDNEREEELAETVGLDGRIRRTSIAPLIAEVLKRTVHGESVMELL